MIETEEDAQTAAAIEKQSIALREANEINRQRAEVEARNAAGADRSRLSRNDQLRIHAFNGAISLVKRNLHESEIGDVLDAANEFLKWLERDDRH